MKQGVTDPEQNGLTAHRTPIKHVISATPLGLVLRHNPSNYLFLLLRTLCHLQTHCKENFREEDSHLSPYATVEQM